MSARNWADTPLGAPETWPSALRNTGPDRAHVAVLDVGGVGSGPHRVLQRRLLPGHAAGEAPVGAGPPGRRDVGRDLGRHRPAHPVGARHRRGHLGRGPAAVPGAQRLRRGDLPHLLLQPARRRRGPHDRDALRRHGEHRARRGRAADGEPARSGRGGRRHTGRARRARRRHRGARAATWPTCPSAPPTCSTPTARPASAARPGSRAGSAAAPSVVPADDPDPAWPTARLLAGEQVLVEDLADRFPDLPTGTWQQPPTQAVAVPIAASAQEHGPVTGFLVVGLNPHRRWDDAYRGFVDLVANQIAVRAEQRRPATRPSAAGRRRWPSSTGPRPTSSATSATSSGPRSR